jgi:hypothetical protein
MSSNNAKFYSNDEMKQVSRGVSLDMSSDASRRRLEIVDELRELAMMLGRAKKLGRAGYSDSHAPPGEEKGRENHTK